MTYPYITYLYNYIYNTVYHCYIHHGTGPPNPLDQSNEMLEISLNAFHSSILEHGPHKMFTNCNLSNFQNSLLLPQGNLANLKIWEFMVPKTYYCRRTCWLGSNVVKQCLRGMPLNPLFWILILNILVGSRVHIHMRGSPFPYISVQYCVKNTGFPCIRFPKNSSSQKGNVVAPVHARCNCQRFVLHLTAALFICQPCLILFLHRSRLTVQRGKCHHGDPKCLVYKYGDFLLMNHHWI